MFRPDLKKLDLENMFKEYDGTQSQTYLDVIKTQIYKILESEAKILKVNPGQDKISKILTAADKDSLIKAINSLDDGKRTVGLGKNVRSDIKEQHPEIEMIHQGKSAYVAVTGWNQTIRNAVRWIQSIAEELRRHDIDIQGKANLSELKNPALRMGGGGGGGGGG